MAIKYAYFRGCVADQSAKENDMATRAVCKRLGIELVDMPFHCCGGGLIHEVNEKAEDQLNDYNLDLVRKESLDIMTICSVCNSALKFASRRRDGNPGTIRSFEEVVIKEIGMGNLGNSFSGKLKGIKIAPFYGCKSLRPEEFNPFGDSGDPSFLEDFIAAIGGTPVKYYSSKKCCGFPDLYVNQKVALTMGSKILKDAKENHADMIVTPCPLCQMTLDVYQGKMGRLAEMAFDTPVLHFSQLLGIALDIPKRELGLDMNIVPTGSMVIK